MCVASFPAAKRPGMSKQDYMLQRIRKNYRNKQTAIPEWTEEDVAAIEGARLILKEAQEAVSQALAVLKDFYAKSAEATSNLESLVLA